MIVTSPWIVACVGHMKKYGQGNRGETKTCP